MLAQQTFAGNPLDRAANRRDDAVWLEEAFARARRHVVSDGKVLVVEDGSRLATVSADTPAGLRLFLGLDGETPVFALDTTPAGGNAAGEMTIARWDTQTERAAAPTLRDLRSAAGLLPAGEAAIAATAKAVIGWHATHRYCGRCAREMTSASAGWRRKCPSCGSDAFPRTDPVVIMLVSHGDTCLLGRQKSWPPGRVSALAGFVEPGESPEEACAREVFEEAGLRVRQISYRGTQPWPFPYSLMIGLSAEADTTEIVLDDSELESAAWFSRSDVLQMIAGTHPTHKIAPPSAIAHHLIKEWAQS